MYAVEAVSKGIAILNQTVSGADFNTDVNRFTSILMEMGYDVTTIKFLREYTKKYVMLTLMII